MARDLKPVFSAMGARLAIARNKVGLTQTAMADAIGVSQRAYHSYEKGQRGLPVEALVAISDKFDVDAAWILLGAKSVRAAHDFEGLKRIEISLDQHLTEEKVRIRSEKRGTIIALGISRSSKAVKSATTTCTHGSGW